LTAAISTGECASAPWGATSDLVDIGEDVECGLVSKGDVDETVVGEGGEGGNRSGFLPTSNGSSGDEDTCVLAPEGTGLPLTAGLVPEGLPLGGEVTVTSGNAKEEAIVRLCSHASVIKAKEMLSG
jgi:hypothetical protein